MIVILSEQLPLPILNKITVANQKNLGRVISCATIYLNINGYSYQVTVDEDVKFSISTKKSYAI